MKILLLSMMILISSGILSQKIEIKDLDAAILKADSLIETDSRIFFKNVESFIVFYDGKIRFEKYYNGAHKDSLHHIQSQTKSIVSLLMGIAIDKGYISSENEPVKNYFPEYFKPGDPAKSALKIKDMLTMSAGFDWQEMIPPDDPENDNIKMFNSNDFLHYILSKPVLDASLARFNYNSGCPVIIAGIIEKSTKMSLEQFAELDLFKPLKISNYRWIKDSTGLCHAGGGLYLKPGDMLKIGILMNNNGRWENQQIISEHWIQKAIKPYFPTDFDTAFYGYFWWVREMSVGTVKTTTVISAEGAGGQKLYIFPEFDLIIAFTERNFYTPQVSPLFIKESVLPLLQW